MNDDVNVEVVKKILNEEVSFFTDKLNETQVYIEYPLPSGARCFAPVKDGRFEAFLSHRYRTLADEPLCPSGVFDFLEMKKDDVLYSQTSKVTIHRRVAGTLSNKILYFLADELRQTVMVTKDGWKVGQGKNVKFLKAPADLEQVKPVGGGDLLKLLRPFVNLPMDDFLLFAAFLVQSFSRSSSHYAAVVSSNKGTGKSTLTKMMRSLIDPSATDVPLTPTSENDLKTVLANTYLAAFDNTATLSSKYSDILCAAITGTKDAKRKLNLEKDALFAAGYDFGKKRIGDFNHLIITKIPQNQQTKAQRESAQRRTLLDDASIED